MNDTKDNMTLASGLEGDACTSISGGRMELCASANGNDVELPGFFFDASQP